jgi:hypothetical protein
VTRGGPCDYVSARSPVSASPRISVWISEVPS